jgi:hypothetical protein
MKTRTRNYTHLAVHLATIYDCGLFELQIEDLGADLTIQLTFPSEAAKDKFLESAETVRRPG